MSSFLIFQYSKSCRLYWKIRWTREEIYPSRRKLYQAEQYLNQILNRPRRLLYTSYHRRNILESAPDFIWYNYSGCFLVFSFRNCISNPRLSSSEILYASFFCNGIRETLFSLLDIGQILNESSFIVSSNAEFTKKVAHQWQYSQIANWRLYSFKDLLTVLTENRRYIFHRI